ncbi:MAG: sigma-54 dependent transcriptional regulator [Treponema sp.]|jgi:two-component system response regulator AtoC|nr:sigma-54 dependent transcriptional regulator [Treponema sp.]
MKILIVDDERNIRVSLKKYLSLEDIDSEGAESGEAALAYLEREHFDAIVLDLKLPLMNGQQVLEWMQKRGILTPVIMISAHGQIADAVNALKCGAKDYLVKPFDPTELSIKLHNLVENKRRENLIEAENRTGGGGKTLIGSTPVMQRISAQLDKIASADVTVLITGESGTGKEVVAREIHARSSKSAEPFVAVNIGGIHEALMESELFGHEKGAFTSAIVRKQGLFELAGNGCLFLDEIGEMPMSLQVKLLRVLQERKIRRLGGVNDIPVTARIVSATNRNLEELVKEGKFREDLYYRINVFRVEMPPLRDRCDDIPQLAAYLVRKLSSRMGRAAPRLSADALEYLRAYPWPGNIRELENVLERALIFGDGAEIKSPDLDLPKAAASLALAPPAPEACQESADAALSTDALIDASGDVRSLESIEREAIRSALLQCQGNRTKAAEQLGVSRKTILNKIKAYAL